MSSAVSSRVQDVLTSLTLEEKISLLAGATTWETKAIPSKSVSALKVSDGPNGARGSSFFGAAGAVTSACFPAACSVASSFDVDVAHRVGVALGQESRSKGVKCLLAPTVCIHRHPLGGRNFESYSEDPYLSGKLAAMTITGIQSVGISATIKHFACNEQETERLTVDEIVSEKALREIYLKPFEIAVKESRPDALMTAYNKVNGIQADANSFLLDQVLHQEWKWDGLVMSDWGGTTSTTESLISGLDLEMPGTARWRKPDDVIAALDAGKLTQQTIDDRATNVLAFLERHDLLQESPNDLTPEKAVDLLEHRTLVRECGAKGIVMLKNDGDLLPLTHEKVKGKKIALFGLAKQTLAHGGGSASVNAHYTVNAWDAVNDMYREDEVDFMYARGAHTFRQLPLLSDGVTGDDGNPGFTLKIFAPGSDTPERVIHGHRNSEMSLLNSEHLSDKCVELTGWISSETDVKYYLTLSGLGPSRLLINDQIQSEQKDSCADVMGFLFGGIPVSRTVCDLRAGQRHHIRILSEPRHCPDVGTALFDGSVSVRLGWMDASRHDEDLLPYAVQLASAADFAIIFTGHESEWETEGQDQASFNLPKDGSQDRLVAAVATANPNTIVVNSTGVPVALPWLHAVPSVLQAWFPGQEAGNAIADVLSGKRNPEGHLPCTWPKRIEDCPAYGNFPGEYEDQQLTVRYDEGIFVGYRHFDRHTHAVQFPFGHGISYTSFEFADSSVRQSSKEVFEVTTVINNTGNFGGAIAVQIYVGATQPCTEDPIKILVGFRKVFLAAGESRMLTIPIATRDFASWDQENTQWIVKGGLYNFSVGRSAGDLVATIPVPVEERTYSVYD